MRELIQGMGWFARRVSEPHQTIAFYKEGLGLPVLRRRDDAPTDHEKDASVMLWAGETTVLWITPGGAPPPPYTDRSQAACIPLFRVHGAEAVMERLVKLGAKVINDMNNPDRHIYYFLDPSGNVTGLQERARTSDRPEDQEAWRRWDSGETTIPGVPPLASEVQHLGWVVMFSQDGDADMAFWSDVMGYEPRGQHRRMISVGEGLLFEILDRAEGYRDPVPTDRRQVNNVPMLRVHQLDRIVAHLKEHDVRIINDSFHGKSGQLAYFLTPGDIVIGLQERDTDTVRLEDHEADRRWAVAPH